MGYKLRRIRSASVLRTRGSPAACRVVRFRDAEVSEPLARWLRNISTMAIDTGNARPPRVIARDQSTERWPFFGRTPGLNAGLHRATTVVAECTSTSGPPKRDAVRDLPELFRRLAKGSKPIIVSEPGKDETVAVLLRRRKVRRPTQAFSEQAHILADLLGGETVTWELASVMFCESGKTDPNKGVGPSTSVQIRARVLYVDFIRSQVCFKLTAGTIEALTKHHLSAYSNQAEAQKLTDAFKQAIDDFAYFAEVGCLGGMRRDGSGKLTAGHCTKVRAAILKLFGLSGH